MKKTKVRLSKHRIIGTYLYMIAAIIISEVLVMAYADSVQNLSIYILKCIGMAASATAVPLVLLATYGYQRVEAISEVSVIAPVAVFGTVAIVIAVFLDIKCGPTRVIVDLISLVTGALFLLYFIFLRVLHELDYRDYKYYRTATRPCNEDGPIGVLGFSSEDFANYVQERLRCTIET